MTNVNKTLYIPLYGKAYVSRKGILLRDKKAEAIWAEVAFPLRGKAKSKWLAYYMGMRAAVFDRWTAAQDGDIVLHIGCGMDSRAERVGGCRPWYDMDFPEVIAERRRYYAENDCYRMIAGDARDPGFLDSIPRGGRAIVVMEGISMYLQREELKSLLQRIRAHFDEVAILMDCYTVMAAKMSKYKNPVNTVGVTELHGVDEPESLCVRGLSFVKEHDMTPSALIDELQGAEKRIFKKVFAGSFSRKLYRLFEYRSVTL
ncbi:MAG: class I SAM-dependent methyltransferase [Ruminococcaceae bacterium]|nr:class I SAM-dependent methyltransferase [Oscillospiraceae bacterium]